MAETIRCRPNDPAVIELTAEAEKFRLLRSTGIKREKQQSTNFTINNKSHGDKRQTGKNSRL
jgi:hypothetical protein